MGLLDKVSSWLHGGGTPATLLVVGLDGAGKSSLLAALSPAAPAATPPAQTGGLTSQQQFSNSGVSFAACEVSGAARHRALWERHYRRADAVIYVVDAADQLRLVVAREELSLLAAHPDVCARRVPLLVLANKSDAPAALSAAATAAALGLERISTQPWHVCATSAATGAGLADGVAWLARQLRDHQRRR